MLTLLYEVTIPIIAPVRAEPGHCLVVRPAHPTRPLVVVGRDADGDWHPIRTAPLDLPGLTALVRAGVLVVAPPLPALSPDPRPARSA